MRSMFAPLTGSYLGFDRFFDEIDRMLEVSTSQSVQSGFPPLNVYKEGDGYTIELAVAGFKESDIKIEHDEKHGTLTVFGDTGNQAGEDDNRQAIRRGIASRKFVRSFTVADNLKVDSASLEHGMLTIKLAADEEKTYTPRQIPLSTSSQLEYQPSEHAEPAETERKKTRSKS